MIFMIKKARQILFTLVLILSISVSVSSWGLSSQAVAEDFIKTGEDVYRRYCIGCHGEKGEGKGKAASLLVVKPRNFTTGIFKFKSTPGGSLPTDEDLMQTITRGLPGSSMPSFILMPERERSAVVEYIKTFSERWKNESRQSPITIPVMPEYLASPESIRKGKNVYIDNGCIVCHGEKGDGKGPAAIALKDVWDMPVKPRNFKRGIYRSGSTPKDIFRTLTTGIEGTPMPAFPHVPEEDRWHVVSYLLSLKGGK